MSRDLITSRRATALFVLLVASSVVAHADPLLTPLEPTPTRVRCSGPDASALGAIVPIASDDGAHASGVVVGQGEVLTAAHAVQGGGEFFIDAGQGFRPAILLLVDHAADLAMLSADTGTIRPLPIALSEPFERQMVWAVGYPRARGITTSTGEYQLSREGALHTSAAIDAGQSGGGLLACTEGSYHLLGILRGYGAYRHDHGYVRLENHSVAVAASTIHRFLDVQR